MAEIHPNHSRLWERWKTTAIEWLSVIIAGFAVIIALFAHFEATKADIRSEMQVGKINELSDEVAYWTAHTTALRAELKANGYEPPKLEER